MSRLLATLVQISDLHIGDIDPASGNATLNARHARMVSSFKALDGLLGHHAAGLDALARFIFAEKAAAASGVFRLMVTGDLSRCGSRSELELAREFICGQIDVSPPLRNLIGLQLAEEEVICIPGNHDQWGGKWHPVGGTPSHYKAHMRAQVTPYVLRIPLLGTQRDLVVVGVDSDRNIWPWGIKRLLAVGSFKDELNDQRIRFHTKPAGDIRVLLVHHSLSVRTKWLRMEKTSRLALEHYLNTHGFKVTLTGHTHLFSLPKIGTSGQQFEEIRCGSTTQLDQVPYNWSTLTGKRPKRSDWKQNTLLVHRIYEQPGLTTWETQVYGRFPGIGFKALGYQHSVQFVV